MGNPVTIAEILSQYGGWGLSAVLFVVCGILYKSKEKFQAQMVDRLISMTETVSKLMTESNILAGKLETLMSKVHEKL
jgi:hypothetical protein